jgi:hypothetical protein
MAEIIDLSGKLGFPLIRIFEYCNRLKLFVYIQYNACK